MKAIALLVVCFLVGHPPRTAEVFPIFDLARLSRSASRIVHARLLDSSSVSYRFLIRDLDQRSGAWDTLVLDGFGSHFEPIGKFSEVGLANCDDLLFYLEYRGERLYPMLSGIRLRKEETVYATWRYADYHGLFFKPSLDPAGPAAFSIAWRIFSKGIDRGAALAASRLAGQRELGLLVSVMA